MTAIIAYWPIVLLAWFAAILLILRVFQLGADADDHRLDQFADTDRLTQDEQDRAIALGDAPYFHASTYADERANDHA
jgi:hypothetical protein